MKYGNVKMGAPDFQDEVNALKDNLEKGEISKEEYQKKILDLQQTKMKWIVATNGGRKMSKKQAEALNEKNLTLAEYKEAHLADRQREYKKALHEASPPPEQGDN